MSISWRHFFGLEDENTRTAWGYTFQWGADHWTAEDMQPLKYSYDILAEDCLNKLDELSPPPDAQLPRNNNRLPENNVDLPKRDLYRLLQEHSSKDEKLEKLWAEVNTVPDWVDWEQIERGQDVFYRYGGIALTALAYQSLLGGMGANRVVETLARTGGFGVKVARHRIYETTQHILQVTKSLDSIKPGGDGHASSVRVRLLHAAVRRRILKLTKERPGYYDVEKFGVPINDLDSIGTIITFSATLIWVGFPRQGIRMRDQEIKDYIALWRVVAYYVGTPTDIFADPEKTKAVMESLMLSEINPNKTSQMLANNIILSLAGRPPAYASKEFLSASARWLNGKDLSDALGLMKPSFYYTMLMAGQCLFFNVLVRVYRFVPAWDKKKIIALKRIFYTVIVDAKFHGLGQESTFEFKHIPDFHITTEQEEYTPGSHEHGVERRNLKALVYAGIAIPISSLVGYKLMKWTAISIWSYMSPSV